MSSSSFDLALVGGGLQNGLIALAVLDACPGARVAIFERGAALGGNHTWCFHDGDVPAEARGWCAPLVAHRWDGYDVRFASYARALDLPYAGITAARLADVVQARLAAAPGCAIQLDTEVVAVTPGRIETRDGVVHATTVVDARGPERAAGRRLAEVRRAGARARQAARARSSDADGRDRVAARRLSLRLRAAARA